MYYLLTFLAPPHHYAAHLVMQIHLKGLLFETPPPVPFKEKAEIHMIVRKSQPPTHPFTREPGSVWEPKSEGDR